MAPDEHTHDNRTSTPDGKSGPAGAARPPVPLRQLLLRVCRCRGTAKPRRSRCCCTEVRDSEFERPDLAIYSQIEQLQAGNPPSWDSPDITTNHWAPFRLMDEARVVVRNLSPSTAASNALVHYFVAPFGIGTPRTLAATRMIHVPPASDVELFFPLSRDTLAGDPRVGVHIQIEHPHDDNVVNNRGAQVHDGSYTSEVGRDHSIAIPVVNDSNFTRQIQLSVLPTDIVAAISPTSHTFGPHEQVIATLSMSVPGFLAGTPAAVINRSVTVVGRLTSGELIGGATKLLRIDT